MAQERFESLVPFCELQDVFDVVVIAIHTCLVERGFGCIGMGEQEDASDIRGQGEEILPENWNSTRDVYALRYHFGSTSQVFLLKVVRLGQRLAIHFLSTEDDTIYDITISVKDFVTDMNAHDPDKLVSSFQNFSKLENEINREIVDKILGRQKPSVGSSSNKRSFQAKQEDDPLRDPPRPSVFRQIEPIGIGQGDRFPGNPDGSGMLMDPFRPGGGRLPDPGRPDFGIHPGQLPSGSVPPGARFDPFGPIPPGGARPDPRSRRFARPDPDHLPPPGFDDDMFM